VSKFIKGTCAVLLASCQLAAAASVWAKPPTRQKPNAVQEQKPAGKSNRFCTVYQMAMAPAGIGTGSFGIYDVRGQIKKKDGQERSTITGVLVVPLDSRYKFVKVSAEVNSKSQGTIKCYSDVDLNKAALAVKPGAQTPGTANINFEWPVPTDIDVTTLHITDAQAR
jgi:hypothetical protein